MQTFISGTEEIVSDGKSAVDYSVEHSMVKISENAAGSPDTHKARKKSSAATIALLDKLGAATVDSLGLAARDLVARRAVSAMVNSFVSGAEKSIEKTNQIVTSMEAQMILLNESLRLAAEEAKHLIPAKTTLLATVEDVRKGALVPVVASNAAAISPSAAADSNPTAESS